MGTMTVIHPDGTETVTLFTEGTQPSLDQLQAAVGGLIEPVDAFCAEGVQAYVNEEGLLRGLPINPAGTAAVKWPVGERDRLTGSKVGPLVGPVVVLTGFPPDED